MSDTLKLGHIRFLSWNIRGIHNPVKRSRVFAHMKTLGSDVIFLQETHLRSSECSKLKRAWIGQLFCSKNEDRVRGTAILIRKGIPFTPSQTVCDSRGRYVIVTGKLYGTQITLANVYGPNWDNPLFFTDFIAVLPDLNNSQLILGGDFNSVLHPKLDRSNPRPNSKISNSGAVIQSFIDTYALSDPWRRNNPTDRQYSFFSPVHHSFSRIDFFLVDSRILPMVKDSQYNSIVFSDHGPVQLDICFPECIRPRRTWRFDPLLLSRDSFKKFISQQIDSFLEFNLTPGMPLTTVWEALKAYLRGQIISYTAYERKKRKQRLSELSHSIAEVDRKYADSPSPELYREKLLLKTEFDNLSIKQTEQLFFKSKQKFYEHGEKAGKLLAHQIRQSAAASTIPEIQTELGEKTTNPKAINDEFKQFYMTLYGSEPPDDPSAVIKFLEGLTIPTITPEDSLQIDGGITAGEVMQAIKSMQSGKAGGPDGFSIEIYKEFAVKLAPILSQLYQDIFEQRRLPQTMTQAIISVLLKKDKDPLLCGSYRPISLLNCDYKILTKILATRLDSVIPMVIDPDQTGFIPGRQSFYNMRRLFNVLYTPHSASEESTEVVVSLDAEKAFDRVEWQYLFAVLEKFGFGSSFLTWIKIIYNVPTAAVRTNNNISDYFPLHRGCRQGCSLSPYLFDLAVEPLAIALRAEEGITGISRGGKVHKVALYADDLLLYISNPTVSIPKLLLILENFRYLSGYKLNYSKSLLLPINRADGDYSEFPFKIERNMFTYLGIKVTHKMENLEKHNFKSLLERTKQDLGKWSALPISLAGRINIVKMTVLPKFLYVFQMIPIFIPLKTFKQLDRLISSFVWNNSNPRMKKMYLEAPKDAGGLGLPNFLWYYWAANIVKYIHWTYTYENKQGPDWVHMELLSNPLPTLTSALPHNYTQFTNPVVKVSLRIWLQFRRHFDLKQYSRYFPVANNHFFLPSRFDNAFQYWHRNGLIFFCDLYSDNTFISFETLENDHNIPRSHYFRFFQIRSFTREKFPSFPFIPPRNYLDAILELDPYDRKRVSVIYNMIRDLKPMSWDKTRMAWEKDLGVELSEDMWQHSLERIHTSSLCIRHGLIQFKVLHRLHYSRDKLSKLFPTVDPGCPRCSYVPATTGHMFWSCSSLNDYWRQIFDVFSKICGQTIAPDYHTAIFGVPPPGCKVSNLQANALAFASLLARRLILFSWKSNSAPSFLRWLRDVLSFLPLEKLRYKIYKARQNFTLTWSPFIEFVEGFPFQ